MIAFYALRFESIALKPSCYCYHELKEDEMLYKRLQFIHKVQ